MFLLGADSLVKGNRLLMPVYPLPMCLCPLPVHQVISLVSPRCCKSTRSMYLIVSVFEFEYSSGQMFALSHCRLLHITVSDEYCMVVEMLNYGTIVSRFAQ